MINVTCLESPVRDGFSENLTQHLENFTIALCLKVLFPERIPNQCPQPCASAGGSASTTKQNRFPAGDLSALQLVKLGNMLNRLALQSFQLSNNRAGLPAHQLPDILHLSPPGAKFMNTLHFHDGIQQAIRQIELL